MSWCLEVRIPLNREEDAFDLSEALEEELGYRSFSGAGFGMRDIGWVKNTKNECLLLEQKAAEFFDELLIPIYDNFSNGNPVELECFEYGV